VDFVMIQAADREESCLAEARVATRRFAGALHRGDCDGQQYSTAGQRDNQFLSGECDATCSFSPATRWVAAICERWKFVVCVMH
jgi:methylaspartate ammonia-lyase